MEDKCLVVDFKVGSSTSTMPQCPTPTEITILSSPLLRNLALSDLALVRGRKETLLPGHLTSALPLRIRCNKEQANTSWETSVLW